MRPRSQARRVDIRSHAFHFREGGERGDDGTHFRAGKKRLPLAGVCVRLCERPSCPRPFAPAYSQAFECSRHRKFFHVGGTHVRTLGHIRLAGERSLAPRFNDACGSRA